MTVPEPAVDATLKLVLIGDPGVGKTSLLMRYTEDKFSEASLASIGPGVDYKRKIITVDDKTLELQIWDTAGQERFRTISGTFYKGAHGILLVYDVTDEDSFTRCRTWAQDMDRYLYDKPDAVKYLVGNKIDLNESRKISATTAQDAADSYFEMTQVETSAKDNINVEETFQSIVRDILKAGIIGGEFYEEEQQQRNVIRITSTKQQENAKKREGCCAKS
uniref:Rab1-like n=1 Tax=Suberites domuncula TaxID=55567 RepID=A1XKR5_SUBDO|nr:Rab1-like [Suberites domuncula]